MWGSLPLFLRRAAYALILLGWLTAEAWASSAPPDHILVSLDHNTDTYILSREHEFFSTNASVKDVESLSRKKLDGDFLWVRRGGKEWVFRDAGTVEQALRLFEPLNGLEPERDSLEARQERLGLQEAALDEEEERLEEEIEALEEQEPHQVSDSERADLYKRQTELESRTRALRIRQREMDADERALDARSDELERKAESALWELVDRAIKNGLGRDVER